jgi:hypothetical protein
MPYKVEVAKVAMKVSHLGVVTLTDNSYKCHIR